MYKSLGLLLFFVSVGYALKCITPPEMTNQQMNSFLEDLAHHPDPVVNRSSQPPTFNTFNCPPLTRSLIPPTSVHKLKPGDIDVVMALGDSLTAANGADALIITGNFRNKLQSGVSVFKEFSRCFETHF